MDNQRQLNKKVELGHLLLITTDQHQLIVDYKIMEGEKMQPRWNRSNKEYNVTIMVKQ